MLMLTKKSEKLVVYPEHFVVSHVAVLSPQPHLLFHMSVVETIAIVQRIIDEFFIFKKYTKNQNRNKEMCIVRLFYIRVIA